MVARFFIVNTEMGLDGPYDSDLAGLPVRTMRRASGPATLTTIGDMWKRTMQQIGLPVAMQMLD
jgi:hypothetical protein